MSVLLQPWYVNAGQRSWWGGQVGADGLTSLVNKWTGRQKKGPANPVSNIGEPGLRAGVLEEGFAAIHVADGPGRILADVDIGNQDRR